MFTVFLVLILIVCFLLILVVMVQNPKGGGLSSSVGGTQQLGGVQKTTDFLDKSTWTLGTILVVLILLTGIFNTNPVQTAAEDADGTEAAAATKQTKSDSKTATPAATKTDPAKANPAKK